LVNFMFRPLCSKESNLLPLALDAVWAPELVLVFWTRKKSLNSDEI